MSDSNKPCSHQLEDAIDAVLGSYDGPEEINNLESAALPNRRAVIEAYNHLAPAIYLGFYSTRPLNRRNLRHTLSEHLYPAYELLVEHIGRAATYEHAQGRFEVDDPCRFSERAVLKLFSCLPDLRRCLNTDVLASFRGDPASKSIEEIVFSSPGLHALTAHRVAHVLYDLGVPMVPRIIAEYAHSQTGIDIHAGAKLGESFCIDHGTGLVIGETTVIGNNVKLYQGVTLGALSTDRQTPGESAAVRKRHPTIEDNVTIYSGAKILGGDTVIGRDSVIGGNVWLVHSVPPGSKIFGRERDPLPLSVEQVEDELRHSRRPRPASNQ